MLKRYKELVYGLLLGIGAWMIDVVMHAQMTSRSIWAEFTEPQTGMVFYRVLYVGFGLALGWSLWQRNKRERDFRRIAEVVRRFHGEIAGPASLIHAKVQALLVRDDLHMPPETQEVIQFVYENSRKMAALAKETLPSDVD